jgi:hypothetical protein
MVMPKQYDINITPKNMLAMMEKQLEGHRRAHALLGSLTGMMDESEQHEFDASQADYLANEKLIIEMIAAHKDVHGL